jgi:hypothetical protein
MQKRQRVSQGLEKKEHTQASEGGLKVEAEEGVNWAPEPFAKPWKKRPRGRPWPKGVSGNPRGRPKGARNKFTEAVREGIRRTEEKLAQAGGRTGTSPTSAGTDFVFRRGCYLVGILLCRIMWPCRSKPHPSLPPPSTPARAAPG